MPRYDIEVKQQIIILHNENKSLFEFSATLNIRKHPVSMSFMISSPEAILQMKKAPADQKIDRKRREKTDYFVH